MDNMSILKSLSPEALSNLITQRNNRYAEISCERIEIDNELGLILKIADERKLRLISKNNRYLFVSYDDYNKMIQGKA